MNAMRLSHERDNFEQDFLDVTEVPRVRPVLRSRGGTRGVRIEFLPKLVEQGINGLGSLPVLLRGARGRGPIPLVHGCPPAVPYRIHRFQARRKSSQREVMHG